jgi:hypothetical protein
MPRVKGRERRCRATLVLTTSRAFSANHPEAVLCRLRRWTMELDVVVATTLGA